MNSFHFETCVSAVAAMKRQSMLKTFFHKKSKIDAGSSVPEGSISQLERNVSIESEPVQPTSNTLNLTVRESTQQEKTLSPSGDSPSTLGPVGHSASIHEAPKHQFSLDKDECLTLIKNFFPEEKVHNYHACQSHDCCQISSLERERLKPKKFLHTWIRRDTWWLTYVEGKGMYCLICKKHATRNLQNKTEKFTEIPSDRLKINAIECHKKSDRHKSAIQTELVSRVSVFHKEVIEREAVSLDVIRKAFSTAYLIIKEFLPNRKFLPLLDFMTRIIGVTELKHFQHRSAGSIQEIFLTLGSVMKKTILQKVQNARYYGIMTDEMTDVSIVSQLVTFVQYFDSDSGGLETKFLSTQNALENHSSVNAETLYNLLKDQLQQCQLQEHNMIGLATDGAAVMVGAKNGLAARLRKDIPLLINFHCVCHRLALACTDSNEGIAYIKKVETTLRQLWQYFENSPKRMAILMKFLARVKQVNILEKNKRVLVKKLKKACKTRWLSFDKSVNVVKNNFEGILLCLQELDNNYHEATAAGLLKNMKTVKFLAVLYILSHVLPVLSELSKAFQKGQVNFSQIGPKLSVTKHRLGEILEEKSPLMELQADLESYENLSHELTMSARHFDEAESLLVKYIDALQINIDLRFKNSSKLISAFSVFDPVGLPETSHCDFKCYGNEDIETIGAHFYQIDDDQTREMKIEKLRSEWMQMKFHIKANLVFKLPKEGNPTEWFLLHLLKNQKSFSPFFPMLLAIAEAILVIPVSNAWPERGASSIKNVKTRLRSRLTNTMLEGILHILINGPKVENCEPVVNEAVDLWMSSKQRRKLPRINRNNGKAVTECHEVAEVEVPELLSKEPDVAEEPDLVDEEPDHVDKEPEPVAVVSNLTEATRAFSLDELDAGGDSDYSSGFEDMDCF